VHGVTIAACSPVSPHPKFAINSPITPDGKPPHGWLVKSQTASGSGGGKIVVVTRVTAVALSARPVSVTPAANEMRPSLTMTPTISTPPAMLTAVATIQKIFAARAPPVSVKTQGAERIRLPAICIIHTSAWVPLKVTELKARPVAHLCMPGWSVLPVISPVPSSTVSGPARP
jgi:hypothetical protein